MISMIGRPRRDGRNAALGIPPMPFDSQRIHEVPDDLLAAIDYCYEQDNDKQPHFYRCDSYDRYSVETTEPDCLPGGHV